jgi:hypothetical protein
VDVENFERLADGGWNNPGSGYVCIRAWAQKVRALGQKQKLHRREAMEL